MVIYMALQATWPTKSSQGESSWRRGLRTEPRTSLAFKELEKEEPAASRGDRTQSGMTQEVAGNWEFIQSFR